MATVAAAAKLAGMDVVPSVARTAVGRQLHFLGGLLVAVCARKPRMRAAEREMRARAMVELPQIPAVRRMTGGAVGPEAALVHVTAAVAAVAVARRALERLGWMALRASDNDMQAEERKIRHIMIEADVRVPLGRRVALVAHSPESAAVHVIGSMAAGTFDRELLIFDNRCVARVAVDTRVRPLESEFETRMIECAHVPGFVAVASRAVGAEAAAMPIVAAVAPCAVLGQCVLEVTAAVAIGTANMGVRSLKSESGLPAVVELRRLPAGDCVAIGAVVAAAAVVHIVRRVARGAFLGRTTVVLAHVAGSARNLTMLVAQGEARLLVVK